jgi:glutamate racemase
VYFGDLQNAPYGNKSREELGALTVLGIQKLIDEGATEIVSACNSVSVSIVLPMFEILSLPHANIIEMVGPTVVSFKGMIGRVLVAATNATVMSGVYQDGFRMIGMEADGVAIPDLVHLIEAGANPATMERVVRAALAPYAAGGYAYLVLGCTHFPLVLSIFERVTDALGMRVTLVDPAHAVADAVVARFDTSGSGHTRFHVSRASATFDALARAVSVRHAVVEV